LPENSATLFEQKLCARHGGFPRILPLSSWEEEMRLLLFCRATVVIAVAGAYAAENGPVRVCIQHRGLVNNFVMARAQTVVNAVFSAADVRIEWLPSRLCADAPDDVIRIEMDSAPPARFGPETMAYAMPYRATGVTIHVFYDRVLQDHHDMPCEMLGHVLAHEIGHVVEGIVRHSADGLMKPRWNLADYRRMRKPYLFFAAEDVELIQSTLQRASAGAVTARSEKRE
jgi:hypothetical protein